MPRRNYPLALVVGPTPPPYNGMSVVTQNLMQSKLAHKFRLALVDTADRRGLANIGRLDTHNILLALKHGIRFLRVLLFTQPDLVYIPIAQNTLGFLRDCLFLIPSRLLCKRVVVHLHGSDFQRFYRGAPPLLRRLIFWTLSHVRRAVVLDESLGFNFNGIVPQERIFALPNGTPPLEGMLPEIGSLERHAQPSDTMTILYLGALVRTKGFLELLRSLPYVLQKAPFVRLILAGEHAYPEELKEAADFIKKHHLGHCVALPGAVIGKAKARLLAGADIFVLPAVAPEGQPLVILEAMSAGLPIIATPQGAIPQTIEDGVNGFLLPPNEPAAIAEKILALVSDRRLREEMGRASRERYLKDYTLDRWEARMEKLFWTVLNED